MLSVAPSEALAYVEIVVAEARATMGWWAGHCVLGDASGCCLLARIVIARQKPTRAAPYESIPIVTRPGAFHELGIVIVRRCSTMGQW